VRLRRGALRQRERLQTRRPRPAPERPERPARQRPPRFIPKSVHRDALMNTLAVEQRPIAEQLAMGGIPAVRRAVAEEQHQPDPRGARQPAAKPFWPSPNSFCLQYASNVARPAESAVERSGRYLCATFAPRLPVRRRVTTKADTSHHASRRSRGANHSPSCEVGGGDQPRPRRGRVLQALRLSRNRQNRARAFLQRSWNHWRQRHHSTQSVCPQ